MVYARCNKEQATHKLVSKNRGFLESVFSESSRGYVKQWFVNSAEPSCSGDAAAKNQNLSQCIFDPF